jgi:dolichyl-phosphooligosaccharide-protein glycotransferase
MTRRLEPYNVPVRRDLALVLLIAAAAFGIRTYPAWDNVLTERGVNFLETDAWYHVRLIEHQVRNFPWRVTLDPYAAPGGQFVPVAPLFDTITATLVVLLHGRDATTPDVERLAALMPPIFGALAVIAAWALARTLFDRRAALLAACLLAILPGHFLDRTMLGFVDHHALEALLALATLLGFTWAMEKRTRVGPFIAGVALGLYLLTWASGAFLIAILGVWFVLAAFLATADAERVSVATLTATAALTALAIVLAFQHPGMHRYGSQVVGLVGLAVVALATTHARGGRMRVVLTAIAIAGLAAGVLMSVLARDLVSQLLVDAARLAPDPARMGVLEARPLFLYSGQWRWDQPWVFFRTGFFIGAIALVPFAVRVWRERRPAELLLLTYAIAVFAATIGQNRFGYYLVTACAVLGGWLAMTLLDWGGVPHADNATPAARTRLPMAREVAIVAVAGGMFAPNLAPRLLLAERASSFATHWRDTMNWLSDQTPPPFLGTTGTGGDYYYARYPTSGAPAPDYAVMNWWDQGYWIVQRARRVPVANPTQERAPVAARFYSEIDEERALELLRGEGVRYVVSDWELPFRRIADGTIMGRFQNVVDWAGGVHSEYYEILYRRDRDGWAPLWVFYEPYYRSMAYRLSVAGGQQTTPANTTAVITVSTHVDNGVRFREVLTLQTYGTFVAARTAAETSRVEALIVGLDPWVSAFPLEPLGSMVEVFSARTAEQQPTETPWVRVFQVR